MSLKFFSIFLLPLMLYANPYEDIIRDGDTKKPLQPTTFSELVVRAKLQLRDFQSAHKNLRQNLEETHQKNLGTDNIRAAWGRFSQDVHQHQIYFQNACRYTGGMTQQIKNGEGLHWRIKATVLRGRHIPWLSYYKDEHSCFEPGEEWGTSVGFGYWWLKEDVPENMLFPFTCYNYANYLENDDEEEGLVFTVKRSINTENTESLRASLFRGEPKSLEAIETLEKIYTQIGRLQVLPDFTPPDKNDMLHLARRRLGASTQNQNSPTEGIMEDLKSFAAFCAVTWGNMCNFLSQ